MCEREIEIAYMFIQYSLVRYYSIHVNKQQIQPNAQLWLRTALTAQIQAYQKELEAHSTAFSVILITNYKL